MRRQIKPVVRFARGMNGLFPLASGQLYCIAIDRLERLPIYCHPQPLAPAKLKKLTEVKVRLAVRTAGYPQPMWLEILAQLPEKYVSRATALEVITDSDVCALVNDHYETIMVVYGRPPAVNKNESLSSPQRFFPSKNSTKIGGLWYSSNDFCHRFHGFFRIYYQ